MTSHSAKILIVEDDVFIRDIYTTQLQTDGFSVATAVNGEDGLKKALEEKPDLILLDILMPVMDGFAMLEKLRQSGSYGKQVPVIMLTNLSASNEEVIAKVAETEPVYYIVKTSLTPDQVVEKVRDRLKEREAH